MEKIKQFWESYLLSWQTAPVQHAAMALAMTTLIVVAYLAMR